MKNKSISTRRDQRKFLRSTTFRFKIEEKNYIRKKEIVEILKVTMLKIKDANNNL